ncbi:GM15464 [Drosophila sechellia]|uniref:GM15464 n=1 Tax=Drosophila sechellia TaxID=7238 RepID=B4IL71_DROSE|nr:GM15464 [Drosophila sechellia]
MLMPISLRLLQRGACHGHQKDSHLEELVSCISNARCALNVKLLLDVAKGIPKSADTMIESIGQALLNIDEVRIIRIICPHHRTLKCVVSTRWSEYKVAKRARKRESFLKLYDASHSDPGSGANRMRPPAIPDLALDVVRENTQVDTYAQLDEGSSVTLIDEERIRIPYALRRVQEWLHAIGRWTAKWNIAINCTKSACVTFTLRAQTCQGLLFDGNTIDYVSSHCYHGVH